MADQAPDPTLGRPIELWLTILARRSERIVRMVELGVPPIIISRGVRLAREALDAIDKAEPPAMSEAEERIRP